MITARKSLVKTGATPGVTRTVNFFLINGKISIADLPGYGYAKVAKSTRQGFTGMIDEYIASRPNLKTAFLLMDIRREPDEMDFTIIKKFMEAGVPYGIVLTKADKLNRSALQKKVEETSEKFSVGRESVIVSSAKEKTGRKELLHAISFLS
jgi:GTP-binding protein